MPKSQRLGEHAANVSADAVCALADGGRLCFYGDDQPETVDDPPHDVALTTMQLANPAFAPAVDGVADAYPVRPDEQARGEGQARWFRVWSAGGGFGVFDGSIGTKDANCIVSDTYIRKGAIVSADSVTYRQRKE